MQTVKFKFHMGAFVKFGTCGPNGTPLNRYRVCGQLRFDNGNFYRLRKMDDITQTIIIGEVELLTENPAGNV